MSVKRSQLGDKVTSSITLVKVKENLSHLHEHYTLLTKKTKGALPLALKGIPLPDVTMMLAKTVFIQRDLFKIDYNGCIIF